MTISEFLSIYSKSAKIQDIKQILQPTETPARVALYGFAGSSRAVVAASLTSELTDNHLFILQDKESASYFHNDLEKLLEEYQLDFEQKKVLFFPASYRRFYEEGETDNANILQRSEVLNRLEHLDRQSIIVTYPEALSEKVITQRLLQQKTIKLKLKEQMSMDAFLDMLMENQFERVDFVIEPGQYAVRGGIVDVFSFSGDYPYRVEFFGDEVDSIRTFDPVTQLSKDKTGFITILPNVQIEEKITERTTVFEYFNTNTKFWIEDIESMPKLFDDTLERTKKIYASLDSPVIRTKPEDLLLNGSEFLNALGQYTTIEFGSRFHFTDAQKIKLDFQPQPAFNKQFDLLTKNLLEHTENGYTNLILSDNTKQIQRLERVFFEMGDADHQVRFIPLKISLHEGFIDNQLRLCCYTDHQIFERFHRFTTHRQVQAKETITLKELYDLKPGDYVTHIDHGIGRFGGLEMTEVGGHQQETIRLVYKDNDVLFISIHALHKISRYSGKDGVAPTLTRLGSNTWNALKAKAKQRVKDIAKDLIKLYAQRKAAKGFAFSPDSYLQNELEASFFYEDTPDQLKATQDVKTDMENQHPMDRLICGDVGFGKTEIAIRAAFKAVTDGKQVAVLVPTTILAFQHFKTFSERLKDMPCKVDYISRFRTTKEKNKILKQLKAGEIDILIGTHRIVGKDIEFKDLGLLIIDEEQKFGVAMKEKLKQLKVNVDTLTLSATPIPRTLQFSLMGARDMSIISTPPPNRFPVHTEVHTFDEEIIRDAIVHELSRGGQVFFVHSRVQNIMDIAGLVQRLIPDAKIGVGHGQMDGDKLEEVMMAFIEGETDILIATKIVENGLDIPNANTIIINEAHHYGLSELHQLRGRVGRSNKKSFCYLIAPPSYMLSDEAKKRLRAIEEFSEIGSGFNIAMRDLDIRGAGNVLGAEQSGFIADIGFDTYHKILDEAIQELKENEFKDLYATEETADFSGVKDCVIETDMELLLPDTYVNNTTERLSLYKRLDTLESDEQLELFEKHLEDRFGPIPKPAKDLIKTVKMRRLAKELGLDRVVMKREKFVGTFVSDQDSPYYQSATFGKVLEFVKSQKKCDFKEVKGKLTIGFNGIKTPEQVIDILSGILSL